MRALFYLIICVWLLNLPLSHVDAQVRTLQDVMVLPIATDSRNSELAEEVYHLSQQSIRLSAGFRLVNTEGVIQAIGDQPVDDLIRSEQSLMDLGERTGFHFIVASRLFRDHANEIEIDIVIFSREERQTVHSETLRFPADTALAQISEAFGRIVSKPGNYSSVDTGFLLSIFAPGLGQLKNGYPAHALVSAGLVGSALLYLILAPEPDHFEYDSMMYDVIPDDASGDYLYQINGEEVTKIVFYDALENDWEHHLRARGERGAAEVRSRRAVGLLCGAYLLNLIDALWTTKKKEEEEEIPAFFLRTQLVGNPYFSSRDCSFRVQLVFSFR